MLKDSKIESLRIKQKHGEFDETSYLIKISAYVKVWDFQIT